MDNYVIQNIAELVLETRHRFLVEKPPEYTWLAYGHTVYTTLYTKVFPSYVGHPDFSGMCVRPVNRTYMLTLGGRPFFIKNEEYIRRSSAQLKKHGFYGNYGSCKSDQYSFLTTTCSTAIGLLYRVSKTALYETDNGEDRNGITEAIFLTEIDTRGHLVSEPIALLDNRTDYSQCKYVKTIIA